MKLLLSSLLLASFCARSSWSVSSPGAPAVTQSRNVSVVEGGAVNISCCWTPEFNRVRVIWLKNRTDIKEEICMNHSCGSLLKETSGCSHLTFTNVTSEASGRYICKVTIEVPVYTQGEGNGTVITVTDRNNTKDNTAGGPHQEEVLIYVLRCLPVLALFITLYNSLRTKAQQHTAAAPGIERTSPRRREENRNEEERDER